MQEKIEELDLRSFLKDLAHSRVDFYRFPGNYGDSLIFHGTKTLLDELSIEIDFVEINSDKINEVLLIDGGGNFVDEYSDVRDFLIKKHQIYKKIVILPHTIYGKKQAELLPLLGSNVTLFCREVFSYEFVRKNITLATCYLWHDCAFYNDLRNYGKVGEGVLNAFRIDVESGTKVLPEDNVDISYDGWCMKPLDGFLKKIAGYEEIRTDRLHVAIASAILNKRVIFFANSYYKNLAVYEYSLKKYSEVVFVYDKDVDLISFNKIKEVFIKSFKNDVSLTDHTILCLFKDLIEYNRFLWKNEDSARGATATDYDVRVSKQNIDKFNQLRNDTIRKIDINLSIILNNTEQTDPGRYTSESPGVFIDRLSILFIRRFEIEKLVSVIDDTLLNEIYRKKMSIIDDQLNYAGDYLDFLFSSLKNKSKFFKVFNPVKIYNDSRIMKYLNK